MPRISQDQLDNMSYTQEGDARISPEAGYDDYNPTMSQSIKRGAQSLYYGTTQNGWVAAAETAGQTITDPNFSLPVSQTARNAFPIGVDPNYNPLTQVIGTQYEEDLDMFVGLKNDDEVYSMQQRIDYNKKKLETMQRYPAMATIGMIAGGIVDPIFAAAMTVAPQAAIAIKAANVGKMAQTAMKIGSSSFVAGVASGTDQALLKDYEQSATDENMYHAALAGAVIGGALGPAILKAPKKLPLGVRSVPEEIRMYELNIKRAAEADLATAFSKSKPEDKVVWVKQKDGSYKWEPK